MPQNFICCLFMLMCIGFEGNAQQGTPTQNLQSDYFLFLKNNKDTLGIGVYFNGREAMFYYQGATYHYNYSGSLSDTLNCNVFKNGNLIALFKMNKLDDSSLEIRRYYFPSGKLVDSVYAHIRLNTAFDYVFPNDSGYSPGASFFENAFSWQYSDDNVDQWNSGLLPDWSYVDYRQSPFFIDTKILEERGTAFGDYQNHFFIYDDEGILQEHIIKRTPDAPEVIFKKRIVKQSGSSLVYKIAENIRLQEPKNAMEYVSKDGMQDSVVTQYVRNHRNRADAKLITVSRIRKMDDGGTLLYTRVNDKATYTEKRPITEEAAKKIIEKWKQPSQKNK